MQKNSKTQTNCNCKKIMSLLLKEAKSTHLFSVLGKKSLTVFI